MTEQNPSGNRWEPLAGPDVAATDVGGAEPTGPEVPAPHPADHEASAPRSSSLTRSRIVAAGAIGALLLSGGIGGYALGQAHEGGSDTAVPGGFAGDDRGEDHGPGRLDHDDAGFDGGRGGPVQSGPGGTTPDQGAPS